MKKTAALLISLLMVAALFTGCTPNSDKNAFKGQIYFNGSTSLAPIIASIGSTFTEEYKTWNKVDPSFPETDIAIYVSSGGSGAGVKAVLEGTSDFGMLARAIKDSEKEAIKDYHEYMVAKDALTISVNKNNPICKLMDDISSDLAKKIFSGELKYWDEVDPSLEHQEIVVVIRDLSGGAYEVFQKAIMGETLISENAIQSPSMGALATKIVENKWAIGYAGYGVYNKNIDNLFAFKVDGVEPTEANIIDGSYTIQRPVMFIMDGEPTKAQQAFIDYIYSDVGKAAIIDNGYIPSK
jgi:phosphate transport system substrate-binding protein